MAKQKLEVVVSDLSGDNIHEGTGAKVRITFNGYYPVDSDKPPGRTFVLDVTDEEADTWATQGREQKKRGRPKSEPKVTADEMSLA